MDIFFSSISFYNESQLKKLNKKIKKLVDKN